ncbi:MAG: hypothetical protein GY901_00050 [Actinomycetia bacterium]|nr:hypothetical protein [Actinomycetes bacterium]
MFTLLLAAACAVVAVPCTLLAARRNAAQPLEFAPEAERDLIGLVLQDPAAWLRLGGAVESGSFCDTELARLWEAIEAAVVESGLGAFATTSPKRIEAAVEAGRLHSQDAFNTHLLRHAGIDSALAGFGCVAQSPASVCDVVNAASKVVATSDARRLTTPRAPIVPTGDPEAPFRRVEVSAPTSRLAFTGVVAAVAGICASTGLEALTMASLPTAAAVVSLVAASVVVALVDWDTFYVDFAALAAGAAAFWGLALSAVPFSDLKVGVGVTVAVIVFFEGLGRLWLKLRGKTMGGGDTWIAALSCGVASAVVGTVMAGIAALLVGCFSMIGYWLVLRVRDGAGTDAPVAFGPHLLVGWPVAIGLSAFAGDVTGYLPL